MTDSQLIDLFQRARRDNDLTVIEGVQALKHAMRFDAEMEKIITCDISYLKDLLDNLAPDISNEVLSIASVVSDATFNKLSPKAHRTKVISLAKRRSYKLENIDNAKPVVVLEDPRDLENVGAAIRVSAAAGAAAVICTGLINPWQPEVIRGAAGLQYAVPVFQLSLNEVLDLGRPLIALDADGEDIRQVKIPVNSVLVFGTERSGISPAVSERASRIVSLPMQPKVSSLNLATSVAASLYMML